MKLEIRNICKAFGSGDSFVPVMENLCLDIEAGEFVAILGQSGCGKSTLLRIIGGFDPPDAGEVLLDGTPVREPGRRIFMIFQNFDQLFPWKTLLQNLVYAIRKAGRTRDNGEAEQLARDCLREVGLEGFEKHYPHQLSGGMKQRGALGRALALESEVLLMDEPFSSLDYLTRRNAQETLRHLWKRRGVTVVFVTHDIDEALFLSTRIAVFDKAQRRIVHNFCSDGSPGLKARLETLLGVE